MLISNKELKRVLEQIVDDEKKEHDIEFDFYYIGIAKYFKKIEEIKNIKINRLSKIINGLIFLNISGVQATEDKMIVLFNDVLTNLNQKELIFTLYHEIGHDIDNSREYLNLGKYDDFIYALDHKYCQLQEGKYMTNGVYHDSLSYEILADKYAIKKTREFFQKNPKYKCNEKWLNEKEKSILDRYEQYDASSRIDKIIELGRSNPNCPFSDWPFWLFLNYDGTFKDIDVIYFVLKKWGHNLEDDRIIKAFLNTKAFRDSFDIDKASEESLKYLVNLFGQVKNKKLKVQKHIKFNDIKEATKVYKINNIMTLFLVSIIAFGTVCTINNNMFLDPVIIKLLSSVYVLGLSTVIVVIKDIVEILRNKYNIYVEQEKVDEFISLIQDNYKNDVKSL